MKTSLDFGTMLSDDPAKLRAFKEQTKKAFKRRWLEVAQALEFFGIIVPCGCPPNDFCKICGGSRYRLNASLSPDRIREIVVVGSDSEVTQRLQDGLQKAMQQLED